MSTVKGEEIRLRPTSENIVEKPITEFDPECGILQFDDDATSAPKRSLKKLFHFL